MQFPPLPSTLAPDLPAPYLPRFHRITKQQNRPLMATTTKTQPGAGLDRDTLLGSYRTMLLSRRLDDKEIQLKQQNKIFFQISGAGHEGIQVAAAAHARPGRRLRLSLGRRRHGTMGDSACTSAGGDTCRARKKPGQANP